MHSDATPQEEVSTASHVGGEAIEVLARAGLTTTGAAYALGVLITNVYLGEMGFPSPDLVQARYLVVGALWLAMVGGALASFAWAWSVVEERWRRGGLRNRAYGLGFGGLLVFGFCLTLNFIGRGGLPLTSWTVWILFALLLAAAVELSLMIKSASVLRERMRANDHLRTYSLRHYAYQIVWGLFMFYVLTYVYARVAYAKLPFAIGGGKSRFVWLVPSVDKAAPIRQLRIAAGPDGMFGPVELKAEDATSYFVVYQRGQRASAARLNKETCSAVVPVTP
jgi:hypothetical protein